MTKDVNTQTINTVVMEFYLMVNQILQSEILLMEKM